MYISIDLQATEEDSPEKESKALWQLLTLLQIIPPLSPSNLHIFQYNKTRRAKRSRFETENKKEQ